MLINGTDFNVDYWSQKNEQDFVKELTAAKTFPAGVDLTSIYKQFIAAVFPDKPKAIPDTKATQPVDIGKPAGPAAEEAK